jgi:hypothetical protein
MWSRLWDRQLYRPPVYTELAYAFYRQRPSDEGATLVDHSFLVVDGNNPVAGMQAATVLNEGRLSLQAYEIPLFVMEDPDVVDRRNYRRNFLRHFDTILPGGMGSILYRDPLADGQLSFLTSFLLQNGATCAPIFLRLLDLTVPEEELWRKIRKSYRSLVSWGKRTLDMEIVDNSSAIHSAIECFRVLHKEASGRETRSQASWQRQADMVQAGEAFLVLARLKGRLVSAGFFIHTRSSCLYGSSASIRELFDKPLSHATVWTAILHARVLGCRSFEMGEQLYPGQGTPSGKELGISLFKGGFGGATHIALNILLNRSKTE